MTLASLITGSRIRSFGVGVPLNCDMRCLTLVRFVIQSTGVGKGTQVTNTGPPAFSSNNPPSYGRGAIAFHWAAALLLVWVGLLRLLHDSWPKRTREFCINIHALSGLACRAA